MGSCTSTMTEEQLEQYLLMEHLGETQTIQSHKDNVTAVCFSPDGKYLATAGEDKCVKVYLKEYMKEIACFKCEEDRYWVVALAFDPQGTHFVTGSWDNKVRIYDTDTWSLQKEISDHKNKVFCLAFSHNGLFLASGSRDCSVKVYNIASEDGYLFGKTEVVKPVKEIDNHSHQVSSLSFSMDGQYMATGSNDNLVIIFDIKKVWEIKKCISAHKDIIYEVEFAQNNKWLASGSRDNTVKIWDTQEFSLLQTLYNENHFIFNLSFSPCSRFLVTGDKDTSVKIYMTEFWKPIRSVDCHQEKVETCDFSFDGSLAVGNQKGQVLLFH